MSLIKEHFQESLRELHPELKIEIRTLSQLEHSNNKKPLLDFRLIRPKLFRKIVKFHLLHFQLIQPIFDKWHY